MNLQDDITNGALQDSKMIGKKLLNYAVKLSEEGAMHEANISEDALMKYLES